MGYGGVVTNVSFHHYLQDDEHWEELEGIVAAAAAMGMRLWIYDEEGYPSGSAGGLTLENHPEFEAQGLAASLQAAPAGRELIISPPAGHWGKIYAYAYPGSSWDEVDLAQGVDLARYLDKDFVLRFPPQDRDHMVGYFSTQSLYEGTHAHNNVYASRRYINVLDEAAVKRFIELTYQAYYNRLGKYFGKEIEAFFTDEPAFNASYLNEGIKTLKVVDEPRADASRRAVVPWCANVPEEFFARRRYDLRPLLPYLFTGAREKAQQIRWDFHKTLSEMYDESFFRQIGDFCATHSIAFSGHLLLEDEIRYHGIFEGNFFSHLKHMHIPGIDILSSSPERIRRDMAVTPKLASSIAHLNGRSHVMSEVSAHIETGHGAPVTKEQMMGAIALQQALGVDTFTSYYRDDQLPFVDYRSFCDFIGRINMALQGGVPVVKVALYYPIETIWAHTIPSEKQLFARDYPFAQEIKECGGIWQQIILELLNRQVDFEILDERAILDSRAKRGMLKTPGGENFEVLILPPVTALGPALASKLMELSQANMRIILSDIHTPIALRSADTEKVRRLFAALMSRENTLVVNDPAAIAETARQWVEPDLQLDAYTPQIVCLHKAWECRHVYFLVNTEENPVDVRATVPYTGAFCLYDPGDGQVTELLTEPRSGGTRFALTLKGYQSMLVEVEPDRCEQNMTF
jgi:hypothetical protein